MVSIVAPLCNEGARAHALLSHLRELPGLREAVLADASDQHESLAELNAMQSDKRIRILHCDTRGRGAQMNAGAKTCGGEIFLFLHCDTRLPACALQCIAEQIARGFDWGWFDLRLNARAPVYRLLERMINLRARITGIATGDQAMFVRADVFAREGGFAEIALMEDVEFSRRLKKLSRPATLTPPVLTSARRWRRNGFIRTVFLMWQLRLRYFFGANPAQLARRYRDAR